MLSKLLRLTDGETTKITVIVKGCLGLRFMGDNIIFPIGPLISNWAYYSAS